MQANINEKVLLIIIALFKCLPSFALDTYSPAIPEIASFFVISQQAVLKTFTSYYIGFACGIIIWGAFSDIYGRKKILQLGAILYVISSILCPLSTQFMELILARFGQGLGDAACATVAIAVLRDYYSGPRLLKIMSTLGSLALIAPIIAPIVGVSLVSLTQQWQSVFHFLSVYGIVLLIASYLIKESMNPATRVTNIGVAFKNYFVHSKNLSFMAYSLSAALICGAALGFISSSAIIYLKIFHLSKWHYVILFGINALAIILANSTVKRLADTLETTTITALSFAGSGFILLIALWLTKFAPNSVLDFAIIMSLATYFMSITANTVGVLALHSVQSSFGSAIALKNFLAVICGGISNYIITLLSYANLRMYLILLQLILIVFAAVLLIPKLFKMDIKVQN